MKNPFRCCFGFRDHHRSSGRESLRASLVAGDFGSGSSGVKERRAEKEGEKRGINEVTMMASSFALRP